MIYVFLANGFEEIEALATVDVLRRAGLQVTTVGIGGVEIIGSHNITVRADIADEQLDVSDANAVVLPGGMPGTLHLEASAVVQHALKFAQENDVLIAAICAAPSVLGHAGLLMGKQAIAYPGFEKELKGAEISQKPVVKDGNIITAKGAGVAIEFGLEIASALTTKENANSVKEAMQCQ